ncbi:MAG: hypothetical protein HC859_02270 [Bacteroidia bacterium]|nr:hypothetical protein [Bacteroidia bacterium]
MNSQPRMLKVALRKRATELQKIVNQMKHDELNRSTVCRNLEAELREISDQLNLPDAAPHNNSRR